MLLNKVDAFFTKAERARLKQYDESSDSYFGKIFELIQKKHDLIEDGSLAEAKEVGAQINYLFSEVEKETALAEKIEGAAEDRYIASFKGNEDAVLRDAAEILDALEKEDYDNFLSRRDAWPAGYEGCFQFILYQLKYQVNALRAMGATFGRVIPLVEIKAREFTPGSISKKSAEQLVEEVSQETHGFYNIPDSPATNMLMEVLRAGRNIADLPDRKKLVNRNSQMVVRVYKDQRRIEMKTKKDEIFVELANINDLTGTNIAAKKLFALTMIKANEQAVFGGSLDRRNYVSFPLQELVDLKCYNGLDQARRGFKSSMSVLTSLKVGGTVEKTRKKKYTQDILAVLFTGYTIKNGQCTVYLNDLIDWSFIAQYFTIMPEYYFSLPNRASDLLYYIFYLARQRLKKISECGYFTINFRAIQACLQLPNEVDCENPSRLIKQPIEDAIEAIEDRHKEYYGDAALQLLPVADDTAPIQEFLDNGYLKVTMCGDFGDHFLEMSSRAQKQIAKYEKRREKLIDQAIAAKMTKAETGK